MEFSIKNYYNIKDNLTIKEIIDIFLSDLEFCLTPFNNMLTKIKTSSNEFIYPQDCFLVSKKIKYWIITMCILLDEITANPIFMVNAESFLKNEKVSTIDSFWFFLRIFNEKLNNEVFDKNIINSYFEVLENSKDTSYNVCMEQLLRIDDNELKTVTNEQLVNFIIK